MAESESNEAKEKMKKERLIDKDYLRLSRRKGEGNLSDEGKGNALSSGKESVQRRGQVTVRDQFASMGRGNRERMVVRWSEKSIRKGVRMNQRETVAMKTVNRGKLQRDRGMTRKSRSTEGSNANSVQSHVKTGMYTRIALKGVQVKEIESLEEHLNARPSVKRRGLGRKTNGSQMTWFGELESVQTEGMYMNEKDRYGVRSTLKRARSPEIKGNTLVDGLKTYYHRSRRKSLRMQGRRRSQVRISREKARTSQKA